MLAAAVVARSSYRDPVSSYYGPGEPAGNEPAAEPGTSARQPGSTALLVVLVSVLVLVLCGGGVAALYLIGAKDRPPAAAGGATTTATGRPAGASASPSYDPSTIVKGQCVVNAGTEDAPVLKVVTCGPGTLQILAKIDGTIDITKCKQVAGSTHHYFYDTTPDTLDFVLCLKRIS
jgi:hypothetical protein